MDISPAKIVADYGYPAVKKASGIPLGTLARWVKEDRIPGDPDSASRQMREAQLATALAKMIAQGVPKRSAKAKRSAPKKRRQ